MIAYLLKNWKLLIDLILVVGGIIALTLFDPFGLFTRSTLRNTANLVSSVRSIGELVTAEYYGEVISSLHETKIYDIERDDLFEQFKDCYFNLKYAVTVTMLEEEEEDTRFRFFRKKPLSKIINSEGLKEVRDTFKENDIYDHLIVFLALQNLPGSVDNFFNKKTKKIKSEVEVKVLRILMDELVGFQKNQSTDENTELSDLSDFLYSIPSFFNQISEFHYKLSGETIKARRKTRNKDIVFIGRGWVKAGFKFDQLDEDNFYYDEDQKLIRFYGLSPRILDKDINPWFIPEKKIQGFELVEFYDGADFEEAKLVKQKCKEKLLLQAQKAGILNQSKINGEEALKNFFSLLLDEPDLKVQLLGFPFDKEYQMIAADTLITIEEALEVRRLYEHVQLDTTNLTLSEQSSKVNEMRLFIERLSKLPFIDKNESYNFNLFSLQVASILEHRLFVTKKDFEDLKKIRGELQITKEQEKTIQTDFTRQNEAFLEYPIFLSEFNSMLKLLDKEMTKVESIRNDTLSIESSMKTRLGLEKEFVNVISNMTLPAEDTIYRITHKQAAKDLKFYDLRYPIVEIDLDDFKEYKLSDTISVGTRVDQYIQEARFISTDSVIQKAIEKDLETLRKFESYRIKRNIKLSPIKNFFKRISSVTND